jgi:hypothetical protein
MGQYTADSTSKPLASALHDIFTAKTLGIAVVSAMIGYGVFEYLRGKS